MKRKPFNFHEALTRLADLIPNGHLALASGPEVFLGAIEANLKTKRRAPAGTREAPALEGAADLGRAWNLLADAMHVLDAVSYGMSPRLHDEKKMRVFCLVEEAHGIVQRSMAQGSPARSARPSEGGTTEPRPFSFAATATTPYAMSPETGHIEVRNEHNDLVLDDDTDAEWAKEIAYRINYFEGGEAGSTPAPAPAEDLEAVTKADNDRDKLWCASILSVGLDLDAINRIVTKAIAIRGDKDAREYLEIPDEIYALLATRPVKGAPAPDYQTLYHELLYQVGMKHPGESRHETALRYLRNAEKGSDSVGTKADPEGAPAKKEGEA